MDYFIATIFIITIIASLSYYAWFQIKEYHVDFIIRKLIALGYSTDEIRSRQVYLRKQSNKKLKEIIRELNRKENEEHTPINNNNFFDRD
ncbi:hypothetical protein NEN33_09485 [Staphylococcus epidermidis]|uniref:hypothetical protein n=1 Tax=Staphylococcus epidermidis TaxID=1282 RepID=UPI002DB97521|nr:hypothetical protein [Staphylococcus epidermidis]MEB7347451.1 hypothetical protein [Staphylococcus epidermidis]